MTSGESEKPTNLKIFTAQ